MKIELFMKGPELYLEEKGVLRYYSFFRIILNA